MDSTLPDPFVETIVSENTMNSIVSVIACVRFVRNGSDKFLMMNTQSNRKILRCMFARLTDVIARPTDRVYS